MLYQEGLYNSMDNELKETEKLYRAVYPPDVMDMFWKKDGTI